MKVNNLPRSAELEKISRMKPNQTTTKPNYHDLHRGWIIVFFELFRMNSLTNF